MQPGTRSRSPPPAAPRSCGRRRSSPPSPWCRSPPRGSGSTTAHASRPRSSPWGSPAASCHGTYFVLLQRGYASRRPLARLPARARHRADLRDGGGDRDPRRATGADRRRGHRGDRGGRRAAARDARAEPRARARLRRPDRPADRHLHDLGRPRRARLTCRAALLPADHERDRRDRAARRRSCASVRRSACSCATTAARSSGWACCRRRPTRSSCSRRASPASRTSHPHARSRS